MSWTLRVAHRAGKSLAKSPGKDRARLLAAALLHESSRARTMPTDRILTCRCDMTHWSAEGGHPIQDRTAEDGLTPLPSWTPGAKTIADDGRVAEERVLHLALTMVP